MTETTRPSDHPRWAPVALLDPVVVVVTLPDELPAEEAPPDPWGPVSLVERRADQCTYPLWGSHERIGLYCGKQVVAHRLCKDHFACCRTRS
jgi:hypothetical protein